MTPALERLRQQVEKNQSRYSSDHDDGHGYGELMAAAEAYLLAAQFVREGKSVKKVSPDLWPFDEPFRPVAEYQDSVQDTIANLTHAGALIVAEIDRLLRLQT